MPLPTPLNWMAIPGPQKPVYYWHWRNTFGTSWTEEGAFEGWKKSIEDTLDEEGHMNKAYADQIKESAQGGGRIDPNVRRWLNFMVDRRHMPHEGPFVVSYDPLNNPQYSIQGSVKIEFSREYLHSVLDDSDDREQIARYNYRRLTPPLDDYFDTLWDNKQPWQDNWELVEWVVVDAGRDVYWGYILKIN